MAISMTGANVVVEIVFVDFIMIAECTSAPTIRRLYKKVCYSKILEGTQHIQGLHSKFMGRERRSV